MIILYQIPPIIEEGAIIAVTGYVIVFVALMLLFLFFSGFSKLLSWQIRKKLLRSGHLPKSVKKDKDVYISGETSAAIAMAIYLCRDLHDDESNVITIKKVSRAYSPWSSKIYGVKTFTR